MRCAAVGEGDDDQRPRRVFIQSGTLGEIIPQLDQLSQKIVRYLVPEESETLGAVSTEESNGDMAYDDLRERVDALERAVFAPGIDALTAEDIAAELGEEPVEALDDPAVEDEAAGPAPE